MTVKTKTINSKRHSWDGDTSVSNMLFIFPWDLFIFSNLFSSLFHSFSSFFLSFFGFIHVYFVRFFFAWTAAFCSGVSCAWLWQPWRRDAGLLAGTMGDYCICSLVIMGLSSFCRFMLLCCLWWMLTYSASAQTWNFFPRVAARKSIQK